MMTGPTADALPTPAALDKPHAALQKATQGFESYFLHQMLQEMRKSIPKDEELPDDDNQQQIFQDMLDQTLSDSVSRRGDFGLGRMLYDQLKGSLGAAASPARLDTRR